MIRDVLHTYIVLLCKYIQLSGNSLVNFHFHKPSQILQFEVPIVNQNIQGAISKPTPHAATDIKLVRLTTNMYRFQ
jgi:hypothetical protein